MPPTGWRKTGPGYCISCSNQVTRPLATATLASKYAIVTKFSVWQDELSTTLSSELMSLRIRTSLAVLVICVLSKNNDALSTHTTSSVSTDSGVYFSLTTSSYNKIRWMSLTHTCLWGTATNLSDRSHEQKPEICSHSFSRGFRNTRSCAISRDDS